MDFQIFIEYAQNFFTAAVIFVFVGLEIWLINKGASYLKKRISTSSPIPLKIKTLELLADGQTKLILGGIVSFLQVTVILTDIYFSLVLILSLFPGTETVVSNLMDFIFIPLKETFSSILGYLPSLFKIVVTVVVFRIAVRFIKRLGAEIRKGNINIPGFKPYWAKTTASIINFVLNALLLIMVLPYFPGYESLAFKGVAAFLGALVTIGGSSVIANYMAGIVISYMNPCQVGDWVQIEDTTGEVTEIMQFAIKIRTTKKVIVTIPNTKVLTSHTINFSGEHESHRTLLHTTVSIGYDVPWQKVNELLIEAANRTQGLDRSAMPFVRQIKLDDFYVVYELNAYSTDVRQMYHTYSELHKNVLDSFNEAKIEILSPHYRAERDGNPTTVQS